MVLIWDQVSVTQKQQQTGFRQNIKFMQYWKQLKNSTIFMKPVHIWDIKWYIAVNHTFELIFKDIFNKIVWPWKEHIMVGRQCKTADRKMISWFREQLWEIHVKIAHNWNIISLILLYSEEVVEFLDLVLFHLYFND